MRGTTGVTKGVAVLATLVLAAMVVLVIVQATGGGDDSDRAPDDAYTPLAEPTPADDRGPLPALVTLVDSSCEDDYPVVMQPQEDGTVRLVAEAEVANDGDLAGRATVTATWFYFGGGTERISKAVRVRGGQTVRVPLNKVVPQSDGLRMVGHQHGDRLCRVRVK